MGNISMSLIWKTALIVALGAVGGELAYYAHLPLPWMLGGLATTALMVLVPIRLSFLDDYAFPTRFRTVFVALIGVMIGTQVTPDLLALAPQLPWTIAGIALFVVLAQYGNMVIFQRLGGYDRVTAFYSGTPGGLMESIMMGESSGADLRRLTIQQFLRIIVLITFLPLGLSLWMGAPVGSASGLSLPGSDRSAGLVEIAFIIAAGVIGLYGGRKLRLPAPQLTGPMLLAALATLSGVVDLHLPYWLISVAQLVIGVSLGLRFKGVDGPLLRRSIWLSLVSVGFMVALGVGFSLALHAITGIEILHLMISFAPGGVAEMSIIALSLAANPALVSLHHIIRILLTVVEMGLVTRFVFLNGRGG